MYINFTFCENKDNKDKQQEYYAQALEQYEQVLGKKIDNYEANFNIGVIYYNRGAELLKEINNWDLDRYNKEGRAAEEKVTGHFKKAL